MVTVILPGYSLHNKKWLEETADKINVEGEIRAIYWDHWQDPAKHFDAKEKARLIDDIAGFRSVDIIAKSIGTLVAAHMILKSPAIIHKVIFCGIPLHDLSEVDKGVIKLALRTISSKDGICFQNDDDPHGGTGQLKNFLSEAGSDIEVISKSADNHEYPYVGEFRRFLFGMEQLSDF